MNVRVFYFRLKQGKGAVPCLLTARLGFLKIILRG